MTKEHKPFEKLLLPRFANKVSCGLFGVSEDFIESYQSLDQTFIKNKVSTFLFEADGDSMTPTILKGDILLVDRSIHDFHKRVCIVCYEGILVCKRVFKQADGVILSSDNDVYQDVIVKDNSLVEIWGIVTSRHGFTL